MKSGHKDTAESGVVRVSSWLSVSGPPVIVRPAHPSGEDMPRQVTNADRVFGAQLKELRLQRGLSL